MDNLQILISKEKLQSRVAELAAEIAASEMPDVLVGVLTGSFIFIADLVRAMSSENLQVRFVKANSYGNATEHAELSVSGLDCLALKGLNVLLVDDILDSGNTLSKLAEELKNRGASCVRTCVLLDKPSRREVPMQADYVGFEIENRFVVGYGLDYAEKYRSLPTVCTLGEV